MEKPKYCFQFQPIAIPVKSSLNPNEVNLDIKFIPCQKEKCMAWDEKTKKCCLTQKLKT